MLFSRPNDGKNYNIRYAELLGYKRMSRVSKGKINIYVMNQSWKCMHKNDVRFIFASSCSREGSCLFYVVYVWLRKVVSITYCVVCPVVPVSLDCSDCPFFILLRLYMACVIVFLHRWRLAQMNTPLIYAIQNVLWSKDSSVRICMDLKYSACDWI